MQNTTMLINILLGLTSLVGEAALAMEKISGILRKAKDEGRDVTFAELQASIIAREKASNLLDDLLTGGK